MARRAPSSVPRGRHRLPRCAAPRAHLCSIGTRASWPGAWLPLTGAAPVAAQVAWCARSWRRRSARARGHEARRLPLACARWRRVCRRQCTAAESISPSPGQPPSTPARQPGLLGRASRARRALGALERVRLRCSCADARSDSVVARALAGATPERASHAELQAGGCCFWIPARSAEAAASSRLHRVSFALVQFRAIKKHSRKHSSQPPALEIFSSNKILRLEDLSIIDQCVVQGYTQV